MTEDEWRQAYQEVLDNTPQRGDVLRAADYMEKPDEANPNRGKVALNIDCTNGSNPFVYARLYIGGTPPDWYLYGPENTSFYGWKVVLHPKSRDEVVRRFGVMSNTVFVRGLTIVSHAVSGKSLIAQVSEW